MTTVILYSFRRCPYAMRARMALSYSKVQYHHREILLKDKPQSMLDFSAKGTVPVLVVNDIVIDESLDVMQWALNQSDENDWQLKDNVELHDEIWQLIQQCDTDFKPQLDKYKYSDRHEFDELYYREESLWFLELLNLKLSKNENLIADQVTVADIAIFPFVRQYAFVEKNWFDSNQYVYLQKWLEKHIKSQLFVNIMQKHDLWSDN